MRWLWRQFLDSPALGIFTFFLIAMVAMPLTFHCFFAPAILIDGITEDIGLIKNSLTELDERDKIFKASMEKHISRPHAPAKEIFKDWRDVKKVKYKR